MGMFGGGSPNAALREADARRRDYGPDGKLAHFSAVTPWPSGPRRTFIGVLMAVISLRGKSPCE